MTSLAPGYRALILGASGGIGAALGRALRRDPGCGAVIGLSRRADGLDITREASIAAAVAGLPDDLRLILCATGALTIDGVGPERTLRAMTPEAMMRQFAVNALGPALAIKHLVPRLPRGERALIGVLSARVGSIGDNRLGGWIAYRTAKAALNQILRTVAVELARTHPRAVIAALHPGTVATGLSEPFAAGRDRLAPDDSARALLAVLDGLRPEESGGFFAPDGRRIEW